MDERNPFRVMNDDVSACDIREVAQKIATLEENAEETSISEHRFVFDWSEMEKKRGNDWFSDPEVKEYFELLDREFPHLPMFFDADASDYETYAMIFVPFRLEGRYPRFERQELERFALKKIEAIQYFCKQHGLNCKETIRDFCSALGLDIKVASEPKGPSGDYPFKAERVTSEFLVEFFQSGYSCHMIDSSEEPVLFALVEDPVSAYYADTEIEIDLFKGDSAPVILLDLSVYDLPENPLKMAFLYNVATERHVNELNAYAEKSYLALNVLFKDENGALWYGFTRMIDMPDALRERVEEIVTEASEVLREIPEDRFDFNRAVRQCFDEDVETEDEEIPEEEEISESEAEAEENIPEEVPAKEKRAVEKDEEKQTDREERTPEFEVRRSPKPTKPRRDRSQRLNRVLLKPTRRPSRDVTERMAVAVGEKRVISRNEDRVERLSRRVIILENKLMQKERESLRFQEDLRLAKEQIRFLEQENLELEKRWWKFWK